MATSRKREALSQLGEQLDEIESKVLKLTGITDNFCNLEDNTKRWLLMGIALHTVVSPALRKFVKPELDKLWQKLNTTHAIQTQLYPNHMKFYSTTYLNYETINNNRVNGLRQQKMFDYSVKNSVDLSKLFLQTNMAQFSAFDESCDLSALLGVIIKTGICPPGAVPYAEQLRDQVRNPWAHCNYSLWDQTKYTECFDIMTNLVSNLGLPVQGDVDKWKTRGKEFIDGKDNVRSEFCKEVKSVDVITVDTPERIEKLKEELSKIEKIFSDHECRILKLEQDAVSNREMAEDRQIFFTAKSGLIEAKRKMWKEGNKTFVVTLAAKSILKCIQKNKCLTITGSSGMGKTATLRYIVLQLADQGYDIIPVNEPRDIEQYYNAERKTVFMVDNFCGTFSASKIEVEKWKNFEDESYAYLNDNVKIIVACRLQVFNDQLFKTLSVFKSCECNLLSIGFKLLDTELQSIASLYLGEEAEKVSKYINLYHCFPLLCKLYKNNQFSRDITQFFQDPYLVYEAEIDQMFNAGHKTKYCALLFCVVFNNSLQESLLFDDVDNETRSIFQNIFEVCKLNRETSRFLLKDELDTLLNSFLQKKSDIYLTIHDKMFDFLSYYFGKNKEICKCLIRNARSRFIRERFSLLRTQSNEKFRITLEKSFHDLYMERIIKDWTNGEVLDVFSNVNMKLKEYRNKFLNLVKTFDEHFQQEIADTCDRKSKHTALLLSCSYGDIDWMTWCFNHHSDVNFCENVYGISPLHAACYNGHIDTVMVLLDRGADINKCRINGASPLVSACCNGHTNTVKVLLDRGADINMCRTDGASPLDLACYNGHTDTVRVLLDREADINKCRTNGASPLYIACYNGHTDTAKTLLDKGADINKCRTDNGSSPLDAACYNGHKVIVTVLLNRGADMNNCRSDDGRSPLHTACLNGHTDTVKILLERGADINKCRTDGASPLESSCYYGHTETVKILLDRAADINKCRTGNGGSVFNTACYNGHTDIVKVLLDRGADIMKCRTNGASALASACYNGHTGTVEVLLDGGADINKCRTDGASPLILACYNGHTGTVDVLLDRGADLNKCRIDGSSPLDSACYNGHTGLVGVLLDRGADINQCKTDGASPLSTACFNGHTGCVEVLLDRGDDMNKCRTDGASSLDMACYNGHIDTVNLLLDRGADINLCRTDNGASPLYTACYNGHTDTVKILLDRGADINICRTDYGGSPLDTACYNGHTDTVKVLLDRGADINKCRTDNGGSPLDTACYNGHTDTVKVLLDRGADINKCRTDNGGSPLDTACFNGHTDTVKILLNRGADINICRTAGASPLNSACYNGHTETVKVLRDRGLT